LTGKRNDPYEILQDSFDEEIEGISHHLAVFTDVINDHSGQRSHFPGDQEAEAMIAMETEEKSAVATNTDTDTLNQRVAALPFTVSFLSTRQDEIIACHDLDIVII